MRVDMIVDEDLPRSRDMTSMKRLFGDTLT